MSNQASEDEQTKAIYKAMQIPYLSERHDAIKDLIRTEKLKLLAEVRERVIREHKPANDDDAKYNFPEHYDRLNARHELSVEQLAELTKLEAEL